MKVTSKKKTIQAGLVQKPWSVSISFGVINGLGTVSRFSEERRKDLRTLVLYAVSKPPSPIPGIGQGSIEFVSLLDRLLDPWKIVYWFVRFGFTEMFFC